MLHLNELSAGACVLEVCGNPMNSATSSEIEYRMRRACKISVRKTVR